jgi:hypothetical protein
MGLALTFFAGPGFAQLRVEPLTPRLSPAPAISLAPPSFPAALSLSAPSLAAPAPLFLSAAAAAAAADGPARPANDSLAAAAKASVPRGGADVPARSLNAFWDGFTLPAQDDSPLFPSPSGETALLPQAASSAQRGPGLPQWLALQDRKHAAALENAVKLARSTRAGRRAFDAAQKALDAQGLALPVDVRDLGRNYGEFDYVENRLRLDRKLFAPGREVDLAGTLAHELMHVAQHAQGLPSNALELEIEAHLLDLELMDELGAKPPPHTFARQAQEALAKGPKKFIELIQAAVPGSPFLGEQDFDEIADQLEQDLEDLSRKKNARAAKLAGAVENDLKLVRSKKGRAAYREFSKRVLAELARRSAAAAR